MSDPNEQKEEHVVKVEPEKSASGEEPKRPLDDLTSSMRELAQRLPESINKIQGSIGAAIHNALSTREHFVNLHISEETSKSLDVLVTAGIFESRSEAAAFLLAEGMKSQRELFDTISEKVQKIDQLRSELKSIVSQGK